MTTKQTGTYFAAGEIEEFLPRIGRVVDIEGHELAVFRASDGTVFAVDNSNPHPKGGPLAEGIVSGHYLYDPLYDWKIDLSTGLVQAPDEGQVRMYPVKIEDGRVWISI
ncbi:MULTISPECIES: nitrite reductase small subunit NirD [unclassified Paenibacillus]|uniref:nitrite reductase small subunit NirD n=1 Tax=unclassified Paenibacillus TaxID=185978 RepID=UPI001F1CB7E8|nr:nitrite reductase small subunit NirD [Paenibacillus sp. JJ-223]CAH1226488.1 Assimilatory nitrite reductase [NAD(P)H] small subunit [Paenibacillus sp. JJ-223]